MRVLATIVAFAVGAPPAGPTANSARTTDRSYTGITEVLHPDGEYGRIPDHWWQDPQHAPPQPPRTDDHDLFVDPAEPIRPESKDTAPPQTPEPRPDVEVDPLQLLATEDAPEGRGLLIASGVLGGLATLSGLAVIQVAGSHVACLRDISYLQLVPCTEQIAAHRGTVLLSTGLLMAGLPFLAAGAVRHGRYLEARRARSPLNPTKIRRRNTGGIAAVVLGGVTLATSLGLVANVLLGSCTNACGARSISGQVLWWTGVTGLAGGTSLLSYTYGRTHPAKPKRLRLSPRVTTGRAGFSLSGSF